MATVAGGDGVAGEQLGVLRGGVEAELLQDVGDLGVDVLTGLRAGRQGADAAAGVVLGEDPADDGPPAVADAGEHDLRGVAVSASVVVLIGRSWVGVGLLARVVLVRDDDVVGAARRRPGRASATRPTATTAPTSWATTNPGTEPGAMPANVSEKTRPTVTAGLANEVRRGEPVGGADVGADGGRGEHAAAGAGQGEDQRDQPGRGDDLAEQQVRRRCGPWWTARRAATWYIRLASSAPAMAPRTWASGVGGDVAAGQAGPVRRPSNQSAADTTGLKCAPETGPNSRMRTVSPRNVAVEFSSSCRPTSSGREALRGDAGADDDGDEQGGAEELGGQPSGQVEVAAVGGCGSSVAGVLRCGVVGGVRRRRGAARAG